MSQSEWPGLFVSFEGGEGAGKSSLIAQLDGHLATLGYSTLKTREPGGSTLGDQVRRWLLDTKSDVDIAAMAELCLFLASRAQHLHERIRPALASGGVVLCDRFNDSTIVYQGVGRGLGADRIEAMCQIVCEHTVPDLTFYLDVDPEVGLQRSRSTSKDTAGSGDLDRIESEAIEFHQAIREGYLALAQREPLRLHVIDAHQDPSDVFRQVAAAIQERL